MPPSSAPDPALSPLVQAILKDAPQLTRMFRQPEYGPEHLLATLLHRGQGTGVQILRDLGVDLVDLSLALEARMDAREEMPGGPIGRSRDSERVLKASREAARSLGKMEADTEHLLLALLQIDSLARTVLNEFKLDEPGILHRIAPDRVPALSKQEASAGAVRVAIARTPEARDLPLPSYATEHAAGVDLRAAVPEAEPLTIEPGQWAMVPTGLKIAIPVGFEGQVRPRSGLAAKHGIGMLNGPGTIDADYRGEVKVILFNFSKEPFVVKRGERIAQLVISRLTMLQWKPVQELPETQRGEGGFGHTGR